MLHRTITFLFMITASCNNHRVEPAPILKSSAISKYDSADMFYSNICDSLNLKGALSEAKWRLYCIYSSDTCFLNTKYYQGPPKTFGTLDLKLDGIRYLGETIELELTFYLDDTLRCDNSSLEKPVPIIHSVAIDKKSANILYYGIGDGATINGKGPHSRYENPLQPDVIAYITNNKAKLSKWYYEEAVRRGVLKR